MVLRFGTNGLVGSVSAIDDDGLPTHIAVFLNIVGHNGTLLLAHDHRKESRAVASLVAGTAESLGLQIIYGGTVPAPALAYGAGRKRTAGILVTCPQPDADRTCIRFFTPHGELTRYDEARISAAVGLMSPVRASDAELPAPDPQIVSDYIIRFTAFQTSWPLRGQRIGILRNGSTAAYAMQKILSLLGANVDFMGDADAAVELDLADPDPVTLARCRKWIKTEGLTAVVSTTATGEHPYLMDEEGRLIAGDVLAPLCGTELGARNLIVSGTANGLADKLSGFERVTRCEPAYKDVLDALHSATSRGRQGVVGYDTAGGILLGFDSMRGKQTLSRLLCRDGVLPIVTALVRAAKSGKTISGLLQEVGVPLKSTRQLDNIPWPSAARIIRALVADHSGLETSETGSVLRKMQVAGLRLDYDTGDVVHIEPIADRARIMIHAEATSPAGTARLIDLVMSQIGLAAVSQGRRA